MCVICLHTPRCMIFIPCGHVATCEPCYNQLLVVQYDERLRCPTCRLNTDMVVRVFADFRWWIVFIDLFLFYDKFGHIYIILHFLWKFVWHIFILLHFLWQFVWHIFILFYFLWHILINNNELYLVPFIFIIQNKCYRSYITVLPPIYKGRIHKLS